MTIKYVGVGEFLSGIPARDLTEAEWESLSKAQQKAAIESGLYVAGEMPPGKEWLPGVGPEIAAALRNAGYKSVAAVAAATDEDLLAIAGIGGGRLRTIREALASEDGE
jgi:predicted flap endonuclease-1-like 5' DNA nuclease